MSTSLTSIISSILLVTGLSVLSGCSVRPDPSPEPTTDVIVSIESGTVSATSPENPSTHAISDGDMVTVGTILSTGSDSIASLLFSDNSTLRLAPKTTIQIASVTSEKGGLAIDIKQEVGETWSRVERLLDQETRYTVETPTTSTTVRGTSFNVSVDLDGSSAIDAAEHDVSVAAITRSNGKKIVIESIPVRQGSRISLRKNDLPSLLTKHLRPQTSDPNSSSRWMALNIAKDRLATKIMERSKTASPLQRPVGLFQQQRQKLNIRQSAQDYLNDPDVRPIALEVLSLQYPALAQQLRLNIEQPGSTDFERSLKSIGAEAAARIFLSKEFKESVGNFTSRVGAPPPPGMVSEFLSDIAPEGIEAQMNDDVRSQIRQLLESPSLDVKKDFFTPFEAFPGYKNKKTQA